MAEYQVGNFNFQTNQQILGKMSELWQNDTWNKQFMRTTGYLFNKLTSKQAIRLTDEKTMVLADRTKCRTVSLSFLKNCGEPVVPCEDEFTGTAADCTFDAEEIGIECVDYNTGCIGSTKFAVKHNECEQDYTYEEIYANRMMAAKYALDEQANKAFLAYLAANAGTIDPSWLPEFGGNNADNTAREIDVTDLTPEFLICLKIAAEKCKMLMPCILTGATWMKEVKLAEQLSGGGCCNRDQVLLSNMFDIAYDYDLDTMTSQKTFYLVDMASIAYVNSYLHKNAVPVTMTADRWTWHTMSNNLDWSYNNQLRDLIYDVEQVRVCCGEGSYKDNVRLKHSGGFILNALSCDTSACMPIVKFNVNCANC